MTSEQHEPTVEPAEHSESVTEAAQVSPAEQETAAEEANEQVMDLLSEHVPLSLIMDLSSPAGPDSEQILEAEGEPEQAWWEPVGSEGTSSPESA